MTAQSRWGALQSALGTVVLRARTAMTAITIICVAGLSLGAQAGTVGNIIITQTARTTCALTEGSGGLKFDFLLAAGVAEQRTAPFSVRCSGAANVDIGTYWSGGQASGGTYTFSNGDKLSARICGSGGGDCWDANGDALSMSGERRLILELTYTAASAETTRRTGQLRVSYH